MHAATLQADVLFAFPKAFIRFFVVKSVVLLTFRW